ncbi:uncharacterized protein LOC105772109 [Gossypium raimondii]|uniref:uncharacterized protein LOC105772109 n=1 Tax=Gossypium raimondii TaxID=29730 RepID=UPI00063AF4EC|nr:uncharacterized protein LOC105772109 [Gossypium raimondii]
MAPYEALYSRKCRTPLCLTMLDKQRILGPELASETEDNVRLIRDCLKAVSDRQKYYTNQKMRDIEYSVSDFVFLKVSPWKQVLRFGRKGKLSPRFIGPHQIDVRPDLTFEKEPIQILDRYTKVLRRKSIPLVKVVWHNHGTEEPTWEPEDSMRQELPHLF